MKEFMKKVLAVVILLLGIIIFSSIGFIINFYDINNQFVSYTIFFFFLSIVCISILIYGIYSNFPKDNENKFKFISYQN